ncbi:MAG: universal stress protein [Halomonadaceae bacterium]|nr:universal stress protein [Halomonadaceae bacterium]
MRRDETPPQAVTTARVLVLLDASRHSLAALAAAVELAGRQRAELVALHVEDIELLHCSAFPFACEIGAQSGLSRPLTSSSLAATIDQQRKRVKQTLLAAVAGRQLKHRLEISRGEIVAAALALAQPGDVLMLGKAGMGERWGNRLGSTSRRLILQAPCAVLLWDERQPYQRGPLRLWQPTEPLAVPEWLSALFDEPVTVPAATARELAQQLARATTGGVLLRQSELAALLQEDEQLIARLALPFLITPS